MNGVRQIWWRVALSVIVLCIIATTLLSWRMHRAGDFFAQALAQNRIRQDVLLGGVQYTVDNGLVTKAGAQVNAISSYKALKLAYEVTLARRSPLFGISGTEPSNLHAAVRELTEAVRQLTIVQATDFERAAIEGLYPTNFLATLATLEEARLSFITSASDTDAARYRDALKGTRASALADVSIFAKGYEQLVPAPDPSRFPTLGGTITAEGMRTSIGMLASRFEDAGTRIDARERCVNGNVSWCDASDIALWMPSEQAQLVGSLFHYPLLGSNRTAMHEDTHVALAHSVCLATEPAPYVFTYGDLSRASRLPASFTGNFFYMSTAGYASTTIQYLRDTLDIQYSLINPIQFYICPDVLSDIARVHSIVQTVQFAKMHPTLAPAERNDLLSGTTFQEPEAVAYLRQAVSDAESKMVIESDATMHELETLLNMWRERSATLDALVSAIAKVSETDAGARKSGIPFDVSARTLMRSHTAFPSLFLAHNPSAGSSPLPLREVTSEDDRTELTKRLLRFSELRKTVPRDELMNDLQAYLSFEGIAPVE